MSKQPFNPLAMPNATADSYGPFIRSTEEDRKIKITHFAPTSTDALLRDIESGMDYAIDNRSISEVEVVTTTTVKLTRATDK